MTGIPQAEFTLLAPCCTSDALGISGICVGGEVVGEEGLETRAFDGEGVAFFTYDYCGVVGVLGVGRLMTEVFPA